MNRDTLADATPVGGCARISGNGGKSLDRHRCPGFLDAATRYHLPRTVDSEVPVQDSTEPPRGDPGDGSGD
jgi:hypothetical protein